MYFQWLTRLAEAGIAALRGAKLILLLFINVLNVFPTETRTPYMCSGNNRLTLLVSNTEQTSAGTSITSDFDLGCAKTPKRRLLSGIAFVRRLYEGLGANAPLQYPRLLEKIVPRLLSPAAFSRGQDPGRTCQATTPSPVSQGTPFKQGAPSFCSSEFASRVR